MRIVSALFALALGSMSAESVRAEDSLAYGNEALRAWVERSAVETPYLLVDRAANTVRLMQGGALLRTCPLRDVALPDFPAVRDTLVARVRRHRTLVPLAPIASGPFDWEDRLVHEAPNDGALYFSRGMMLTADRGWQSEKGMSMLVDTLDFRALYGACPEGTVLVYLPADWQRE